MKILLQSILLVSLVSCAVNNYTLKQKELLPYKESAQVTVLAGGLKSIKLNTVIDRRDRLPIGKAYTGMKYNITPIHLGGPVKKFVETYLVDAFGKRSLGVSPNSELVMDVEINHLWVEEIIEKFKPERAKCKVDMSFHLTGEKTKWSGNFWTEYTSAGDLSDGTERLAPTLASCLNILVEKLVSDKKFVGILQ